MSLVVAVRSPYGIAVAGDTLASVTKTQNAEQEGQPPVGSLTIFPSSSTSPKVYSFTPRYCVGVTGTPVVGGKAVGLIVGQAEQDVTLKDLADMTKAARRLGQRVRKHMTNEKEMVELLVNGYDTDSQPRSITVRVTKKGVVLPQSDPPAVGYGTTISGEGSVVRALWKLASDQGKDLAFSFFSLHDAVEHARFLVATTAGFHQFVLDAPTVGGGIDVAVINQEGFQWVQTQSHVRAAGP